MLKPAPDISLLRHGGIAYAWHERAFLSEPQARYALERLWQLVAGCAGWQGEPVLTFAAITADQVQQELDLAPGELPWLELAALLPRGASLGLDTGHLPALCRIAPGAPGCDGSATFPLDLPAALFMALTRWEEANRPVPDAFGCHDEQATQCYRQGFLDRPVLDEWALVLRSRVEAACPGWRALPPAASFWISHDIDVPWFYRDLSRVGRGVAKRLVRQRSPLGALGQLVCGLRSLRRPEHDPCYRGVLDLMDLDESLGQKGTFFFMTARPGGVDEGYDLAHPPLRRLLDQVRERGHEVGWHIGELASREPDVFQRERDRFFEICGAHPCGVRHHYLAWRGAHSWRRMADSGFSYDSSLGYNYRPGGFRCGTAHPFPVYDAAGERVMPLVERPLIVMDSPVMLAASQDSLPAQEEAITRIRRRCAATGGCFSILVHNTFDWYYPGAADFFGSWLQRQAQGI
ncbi:polysaccharide deacetylase family protein [Geomonas paludis]|uniref:DUF7033 domain-containing protein n=1 Tax=Geomonas paludis TaxID=2740185 RepID=A0A6V8MUY6_9BACT|nr:polysaccharide deacetylase family protein [Geomonas paludis]GFO63831.1 hypothetical protein GMPD_17500 [Geomonas paludis]